MQQSSLKDEHEALTEETKCNQRSSIRRESTSQTKSESNNVTNMEDRCSSKHLGQRCDEEGLINKSGQDFRVL